MKRADLVPLKQVAAQLGVSRATIWRARTSGIAGFPAPVMLSRYVFWKRSDLERLEDALLRYQGRVKFEAGRKAQARIDALKGRLRSARNGKRRAKHTLQSDLFKGQ